MRKRDTLMRSYLRKITSKRLLWAMILMFVGYFVFLSFARHNNFYSLRIDLGNMNQTVWNVVHGNGFTLSAPQQSMQESRLAIHADFLLILIAPLYALWQDPRLLLLLQALVVGAGALPVYWIALKRLRSDRLALLFAGAYLLYPTVERITLHDFHAVALSMTFLLFAYWYMSERRFAPFAVFAVLAGLGKEQIWITIALMGLYSMSQSKRWRWFGLMTFLVSAGVFYILFWHAIPAVAQQGQHFALSYLSDFGSTQNGILKNMLLHPDMVIGTMLLPDRLWYYTQLLLPVGFLPLFSPLALIFAIPSFVINTLSNNALMRIIDYQYTSDITPFVFIAAIEGYAVMAAFARKTFRSSAGKRAGLALPVVLSVCAVVSSVLWGELPYGLQSRFWYFTTPLPEKEIMQKVEASISPVYTVSATNNIGAHFSGREFLYSFPVNALSADYVVAKLGDQYAWPSGQTQAETIGSLISSPAYELIAQQNDFYAFRKKGI